MEKLNVRTKKMPCGEWSCYTTFKGQDKAFTGKQISVVVQMNNWLKKYGYKGEIIWLEPILYKPENKLPKPQVTFKSSRIDKGMV